MTSAFDWVASWWTLVGKGLIEGSLALLVLLALWWPLRRRLPARLVCLVFLLPLVRVALPVSLPVPAWWSALPLPGWMQNEPAATFTLVELTQALAAQPTPAPTAQVGVREILCGLWLLGVLALTWRFVRAQIYTHRAVRNATPIDPATLPLDLHALRARAFVFRRVRWLLSDHVATPAAGGIFFPYILLPHGLAQRLPPTQLAFVLLHELAHVRRYDVATALVQRVVQIVWFFHPAVWFANWFIDQHRELACDQDALLRSRASRRECGEAFLSVAAWLHGRTKEPTATLAMFESQRVLRRRLMQILNDVPAPSRWLTAAYLALATGLTLPTAKADDGASLDVSMLAQQDDGEREEIQKLRKQLAELRQQLAKLQSAEASEGKADAKADAKKAKKEKDKARAHDDDDDEHDVMEVEGFDLRGGEGVEPKVFTFKSGGKGGKAFVVEDGEMREVDVEGRWTTEFPGGDGKGKWFTGGDPEVKVFVDTDGTKSWVSGDGDGKDFAIARSRFAELPREIAERVRTRMSKGTKVEVVEGEKVEGRVVKGFKLDGGDAKVFKVEGGKVRVLRGDDADGGVFVLRDGDGEGVFHFKVETDGDVKREGKKVIVRRSSKGGEDTEECEECEDDDGDAAGKRVIKTKLERVDGKADGKDGKSGEWRVLGPKGGSAKVKKVVNV